MLSCEECGKECKDVRSLNGHKARMHSNRQVVLKEIDHGTPAGARMHRRRNERPCNACQMAWRFYIRKQRALHG